MTREEASSALIGLIEAAKNSVRGPEKGPSTVAMNALYVKLLAALTTPAPAADAVALVDAFGRAVAKQQAFLTQQAIDDVDAARAALLARMAAPAGWQLVPVVPTRAMIDAWATTWHRDEAKTFNAKYTAMLAAAPKVPT